MPGRRPENRQPRSSEDRRPGSRRRPSERPYAGDRRGGTDGPYSRGPNPRSRRAATPRNEQDRPPLPGERLQKVLAAAGVASRRDCEELITQGRVEIDGRIVSELGIRVDVARSIIKVDGVALARPKLVYYAVNKPAGVLCTNDDPDGRERVIDLVPSKDRLFTIGRLDQYSEGLIIVTNDGELANKLAHPRYEVPKEYIVEVAGHLTAEDIRKLLKGVHLAEGVAKVEKLYIRHRRQGSMTLDMVLREGKNREIRRVLARLGHKVMKLKRVAIGPLRLAKMPLGSHRRLTVGEVRDLEHYDPKQDKKWTRRTKMEPPSHEEAERLEIEHNKVDKTKAGKVNFERESPARSSNIDGTKATPRKRPRREAADLHGHLEGAPPGRVLRRPKPVKSESATRGVILGGETSVKLKPSSVKFLKPWEKPLPDDDLDEV